MHLTFKNQVSMHEHQLVTRLFFCAMQFIFHAVTTSESQFFPQHCRYYSACLKIVNFCVTCRMARCTLDFIPHADVNACISSPNFGRSRMLVERNFHTGNPHFLFCDAAQEEEYFSPLFYFHFLSGWIPGRRRRNFTISSPYMIHSWALEN